MVQTTLVYTAHQGIRSPILPLPPFIPFVCALRVCRSPPPRPLVDFRSRETYTFDDRGYVPFALSATVIVLRRSPTAAIDSAGDPVPTVLRLDEMATDSRGGVGGLAPLFATVSVWVAGDRGGDRGRSAGGGCPTTTQS